MEIVQNRPQLGFIGWVGIIAMLCSGPWTWLVLFLCFSSGHRRNDYRTIEAFAKFTGLIVLAIVIIAMICLVGASLPDYHSGLR